MDENRHEKRFEDIRPHLPVYKPGDPRIQQDLRRGAGVGVDLSELSSEERARWWKDREAELLSGGVRTPVRDLIQEANESMLPDNERYPQKDDDEDDSRPSDA